jgi:hypothetical protein
MASVTRQLQVGHKVSVTELESGCQLTVVDAADTGLTVIETAADYVVLEDVAGEVQTRIPSYLVRAVTGLREVAAVTPAPMVEAPRTEPLPVPSLEMPAAVESAAAIAPEAA